MASEPAAIDGPRFDGPESYALRVLDAMATGRPLPSRPPRALKSASDALTRVGMRRLAAHAHRALLNGGGGQLRTVLRDGRRVEGRLWDAALNGDFALRFTRASEQVWMGIVRALPALAERAARGPILAQHARQFGRFVPKTTASGDAIVYALAARHFGHRLPTLGDHRVGLTRALARGAPLAQLLTLVPTDTPLRALFRPERVRVLECTVDLLLTHWQDLAAGVGPEVGPFWPRATEVLTAYVAAADEARRLDLTEPVLRFMAFLDGLLPGAPAQVRASLARSASGGSARTRHQALAEVASTLAVSARLRALRHALGAAGYGDERYEEGQVYLRLYDQRLAPRAERLQQLEQALRGAIG